MTEATNDWERRYNASVACPACGRVGVCAPGCPTTSRRVRRFRLIAVPIFLVLVVVAVASGNAGDAIPAIVGGLIGWWIARAALTRRRRDQGSSTRQDGRTTTTP